MDKRDLITKTSVWKLIPKLAIPSVVITLVMVIYNMADIFFIGQTGDSNMVNAVSVCMPVFTIIQAFGTLIGGGGCTAIAIALGSKEYEKTKRISSFCCWFSVLLGGVFAVGCNLFAETFVRLLGATDAYAGYAVAYLRIISMGSAIMIFSNGYVNIIRADGSAKEAMVANLTGTLINIVLDPILILGLRMGVAGAAIATVIGNLVTMLMVVRYVKKSYSGLSLSLKDFAFRKEHFKALYYGLPLAIGSLLMSISFMVMNNLLSAHGDNATGAFGIARSIMMISTLTQMGICMGMQPAISFNYGAGYWKRVKEIVLKTGVVEFILGVAISCVCILLRDPILHAFLDSADVYQYTEGLLIGCMCTSCLYGIFQLCTAFLQSTDKPSWGTFVTILRQGLVFIPAMILLDRLFGFEGLIFAIPVTDTCAAVAGLILSVVWYQKKVEEFAKNEKNILRGSKSC